MINFITFKAAFDTMISRLLSDQTASLMLYRIQNKPDWCILDMSSPAAIAEFYSGQIAVPMLTLNRIPLSYPPTVRIDFPQAHVHGFMPLHIIEKHGKTLQ